MACESTAPPSATRCGTHASPRMRFAVNCGAMKLICLRVDLALPPPLLIAIHSQLIDSAPAPLQAHAPQPTPPPAPAAEPPARRRP